MPGDSLTPRRDIGCRLFAVAPRRDRPTRLKGEGAGDEPRPALADAGKRNQAPSSVPERMRVSHLGYVTVDRPTEDAGELAEPLGVRSLRAGRAAELPLLIGADAPDVDELHPVSDRVREPVEVMARR